MQKYWTLEDEMYKLTRDWMQLVTVAWTEDDWNQQFCQYNKILAELKILANSLLETLYNEKQNLEKRFPDSIFKKIHFLWLSPKVRAALKRYEVIKLQIEEFENCLKRKEHEVSSKAECKEV